MCELCYHSPKCEVFGPLMFYCEAYMTGEGFYSISLRVFFGILFIQSALVKVYYVVLVWNSDVLKPFCEEFIKKKIFSFCTLLMYLPYEQLLLLAVLYGWTSEF